MANVKNKENTTEAKKIYKELKPSEIDVLIFINDECVAACGSITPALESLKQKGLVNVKQKNKSFSMRFDASITKLGEQVLNCHYFIN